MKKAAVALLCIVSFVLFAFTKQPETVTYKKLAGVLYQTKTKGILKTEDNEKLKSILVQQYGIKSFTGETTITFKKIADPKNPSKTIGFSVAEKTVGNSIFAQTIVNKGAGELDEVNQGNPTHPTFNQDVANSVAAVVSKYNH